jgi:hypothetical protein
VRFERIQNAEAVIQDLLSPNNSRMSEFL